MNELLVAALETTGSAGSVALARGEESLGEEVLGEGTVHGAALHPALDRLLRAAGAAAGGLGLVVVGTGPGSFTGMRVGVGAARTLAFAAGCPVIGVPSFDALAAAAPAAPPAVAAVRDARREAVYFALYGEPDGDGGRREVLPPARLPLEEAASRLPAGTLVLGEHAAALAARAPAPGVGTAAGEANRVRASVLAALGLARFLREGAPDPATVLPLYLQPPLAVRRGEGVRRG